MAKVKETKGRPMLSPEAREQHCIGLAMDLVEQRLKDGSATAQEVVYFLKAGSTEGQKRIEKLEEENKLLRAKTKDLESSKDIERITREALAAFTRYSGEKVLEDD